MIDELELLEYQKTLLKNRFLDQVVLYDKKAKTAEFFYILFSVFITIGSIILPALLSIQQMDYSDNDETDEKIQITIYWITWTISIMITICNGLIQLLGLNKQYLSFIRTREKMLSEGWYYFQLTGDYKESTHKISFSEFCEEIEKIKENQVDKELMFMEPKKKKEHENTNSINSIVTGNSNQVNTDLRNMNLTNENEALLNKDKNINTDEVINLEGIEKNINRSVSNL
tara:strand:- start:5008 stop:5694 length:687 start_codon:yes stop_codon:yes gene_type:complete